MIKEIISNLLFLVIVFFLYRFRYKISKKIPKELVSLWLKIFELCKIKYNRFFTSVFLPIISIILYWYFMLCVIGMDYSGSVSILYKVNSIILASIIEEIVFRGIFLGSLVIFFSFIAFDKLKWKKTIWNKISINTWSLIMVSVIFSVMHFEGKVDPRYFAGMIFGVLYLIDKKNLLPAIIAHALFNFILIYISKCPFT